MSETKYATMAGQLMESIMEASTKPRLLPALILFYTSIDILSSLTRPKNQPSTNGAIFKNWVSRYMLPGSDLTMSSDEIWAARCGLLHTSTVESDLSRAGHVRRLHYVFGPKDLASRLQYKTDPGATKDVVASIPHLLLGFVDGVAKFTAEIQADPDLREIVYYHCDKLVVQESLST